MLVNDVCLVGWCCVDMVDVGCVCVCGFLCVGVG